MTIQRCQTSKHIRDPVSMYSLSDGKSILKHIFAEKISTNSKETIMLNPIIQLRGFL